MLLNFTNSQISVIKPPAVEPLTLAQAKAYLRVEFSDDDELISDLIVAARLECEHITNRTFISTGLRLVINEPLGNGALDFLANGSLPLPRPPLISVDDIVYHDWSGNASSYDLVVTGGTPGRIAPVFAAGSIARVSIDYTAGYGSTPASVPRNVIQAMRLLVAHYYEHRSEDAPVPSAVSSLLAPSWWPTYA